MPHLVSRAHTWLGLGALLVGTLLANSTAHAVVLEDTGLADPIPLVCPVPPRPTARPTARVAQLRLRDLMLLDLIDAHRSLRRNPEISSRLF